MNSSIKLSKEEIQYNKMIKTPVKKLVLLLGLPTTVTMIITSIYNIADTYFVSQLGKSASGAVGVVFSIMAIIQAIGFTFGMGSGSVISSLLGKKEDKEAQIYGSSGFYMALLLGVIIGASCLIFMNGILRLLGSTETVLPYARDYLSYIAIGAPIMAGSFVMNNILRAEGKARLAMIGISIGAILNIILDPIFIYEWGLNLGISGAAIATIIGQGVSFLILLSMFIFKKSIIKLSPLLISKRFYVYLEIVKVGLPSLARQGFASLATILLNRQAGIYGGDAALSAMAIVSKVFMVIFAASLGIGQGYQPVCGYNYFAKEYKRAKEAMLFTLIVAFSLMTLISIIFFIFAPFILGFFIDDQDVISIGSNALRFQCISLPLLSLNTICNMTYQSIRSKTRATFLSCARQGYFFIPLVFLLPLIFSGTEIGGILGVELTQPLSDLLTCLLSIPFFIMIIKNLNMLIKKKEEVLEVDSVL